MLGPFGPDNLETVCGEGGHEVERGDGDGGSGRLPEQGGRQQQSLMPEYLGHGYYCPLML